MLLDEQHDRAVAIELRRRSHDVVAVTERADLMALDDPALLAAATSERRCLVTENLDDFAVVHLWWLNSGKSHFGLVFTTPRKFPRQRRYRGALIRALDAFLTEHPGDEDLRDQTCWL